MNRFSSTAFVRMLLAAAGPTRTELVTFTALAGLGTAGLMVIVNSVADRRAGEAFSQLPIIVSDSPPLLPGTQRE